ncbi:MAG: phosphotransferase family protein [Candidatus Hodarchaeota archaeon]
MFFEENRKQDISLSEVLDSLYVFFHDIEKEEVKFLYHGTYNVFEVKSRFIFRFPDIHFRNINGIQLIEREILMLNIIKGYVPFSIPNPIYISTEPDNPFVGYEKIQGTRLSQCFEKTSKNQKKKIAKQIGFFLSQLHSDKLHDIVLNEAKQSYSSKQYKKEWSNYYQEIQTTIFPIMNSAQKEWLNKLFTKFFEREENFKFKPTLIHGDFDTSNILVDPKTFEITGIIDFEDSRIYDPAADFLFYEEGNFFLENVLSSYQRKIDFSFKERMKFLYGRNSLPYITFGIDHNVPDMIKAGFELLNYKIKTVEL